MATKKREIYARAAVQLRTHERPIKAERLCPGAMGLYFFLLLDARGEQTHGDVAELVAECSWGAPTSYRRKQAEALIAVGLIERRDDRLHVVKYDEHNDTPDDIQEARKAAVGRQRKRRCHADVTRDTHVTHADVPISISISPSLSGSSSSPERDLPDRSSRPPEWWEGAVEAAAMVVGDIDSPDARWLEYDASRERKGWERNHRDAVGWLTTVMRSERSKAVTQAPPRSLRQPHDTGWIERIKKTGTGWDF